MKKYIQFACVLAVAVVGISLLTGGSYTPNPGVPYTGAGQAVNLGAHDLTAANIVTGGLVDGIDVATDVGTNTTHRGLSNNPHTVTAAQAAAIAMAYLDAKGDLISASGDDTPALLAVGNDHEILAALATETTGHKWITTPMRATMWHDEATVTNGNALAHDLPASHHYATRSYQEAPANADVFTHGCWLKAGTYTFYVLGMTDNASGIIDWTIDGGSIVAGQDWYSVGATVNVIKSTGSVSVATTGWHTIVGTINGKHGSSANFYMLLTKYWLKQASD